MHFYQIIQKTTCRYEINIVKQLLNTKLLDFIADYSFNCVSFSIVFYSYIYRNIDGFHVAIRIVSVGMELTNVKYGAK